MAELVFNATIRVDESRLARKGGSDRSEIDSRISSAMMDDSRGGIYIEVGEELDTSSKDTAKFSKLFYKMRQIMPAAPAQEFIDIVQGYMKEGLSYDEVITRINRVATIARPE